MPNPSDHTATPSRSPARPVATVRNPLVRWVLGPDPERHLNLKIMLGGQVGYLASLLLIWIFTHNGVMNPAWGWPLALTVMASSLVFYLVMRLGWSRRLRDPGLTVPQMMSSVLLSALGCVLAPQAHILLLMSVCTTLAYSTFSLKGRAVFFMQCFTLTVFGVTGLVMGQRLPHIFRPEVDFLVLCVLATVVVMLTWSGSQIAALRDRQRRQREELAQMLTRIENLATHDALTGLHNRRHMNTLLAHHVDRAQRHGLPLTVALLDLDHFKHVNDTHGHGVGDDVLQTFARVALDALAGTDTLARWGGEEFLLLSSAPAPAVLALLDRIRATLIDTPVSPQVPALRVNFSAGVACYDVHEAVGDTINRADQALYAAKAAGRAQSQLAATPVADDLPYVPALDSAAHHAPRHPAVSDTPSTPLSATETALAAAAQAPAGEAPVADVEADAEPAGGGDTPARPRLAWLLGHERRPRSWVARTLIGSTPYAFSLLALAYASRVGLLPTELAQALAAGLFATPVLIYTAVRAGWTARLADPAITLIQMLVAMSWSGVLYATMGTAHEVLLMILILVMTIAVCNLRGRQSWIVCSYAMVLMSGVIGWMSWTQPEVYPPRVEIGCWIIVIFNLPTVMLMGTHLSKLRARLSKQRGELTDAVKRLGELATHDELTGLHNRNHMNEMLAHYARRHAECGEMFTVALIDLDHFKRINDRYGHAIGDDALRTFARQAGDTLRNIDVIARWGGEEFLVLCPQTSPDQALIGLERLRRVFNDLTVSPQAPELRATFSAGLSTPAPGESIEGMLARADAALYEAKHAGRNRICLQCPATNPPAVSQSASTAQTDARLSAEA